jgi:hypothetical protein
MRQAARALDSASVLYGKASTVVTHSASDLLRMAAILVAAQPFSTPARRSAGVKGASRDPGLVWLQCCHQPNIRLLRACDVVVDTFRDRETRVVLFRRARRVVSGRVARLPDDDLESKSADPDSSGPVGG